MKPLLRRRIQVRLINYFRAYRVALLTWLVWTALSLALVARFADIGVLVSLLLLGAITLLGITRASHGLRDNMRKEFHWEAKWQHDFTTRLYPKLRPRRPLPLWVRYMARPEVLELLWQLIVERRPARVLELGSGMSTLVMSYALETAGGGRLVALENIAGPAANTRKLLAEHDLSAIARIIDAPLQQIKLGGETHYFYTLDGLPKDQRFDFVFIDGPGTYLSDDVRYPGLPLLREFLADDALLLVDDIDRAHERRIVERWLAEIPDLKTDETLSQDEFIVLRISNPLSSA